MLSPESPKNLLAVVVKAYGEAQPDGTVRVEVPDRLLAQLHPASELRVQYDERAMTMVITLFDPAAARVVDGGDLTPSITCPKCGRTSYHPKDIEHRFCGQCGFHDDHPGLLGCVKLLTHLTD